MELADEFGLDKAKLWQEYLLYRPLAESIPSGEDGLARVAQIVLDQDNREAMTECFPLISDLICRLCVLTATSAQAERLFSAMKRIKTAQINRLKISTLSHLIRISTEGPPFAEWDPIPAMKLWQAKGQHRISTFV